MVADVNGESQFGGGLVQSFTYQGARASVATTFIHPQLARQKHAPFSNGRGLFVLTEAQVTRILFDDNKCAVGVEYKRVVRIFLFAL